MLRLVAEHIFRDGRAHSPLALPAPVGAAAAAPLVGAAAGAGGSGAVAHVVVAITVTVTSVSVILVTVHVFVVAGAEGPSAGWCDDSDKSSFFGARAEDKAAGAPNSGGFPGVTGK